MPDVEIIGTAPNGKLALQKVLELKPDLMTLDIEMPELDGIGVLDGMRAQSSETFVIVISSVTQRGGRMTMQALEKGAFDFVTKPQGKTGLESQSIIQRELLPRVRAVVNRKQIRAILRPGGAMPSCPPSTKEKSGLTVSKASVLTANSGSTVGSSVNRTSNRRPEFVLIGVSTGGPAALARVLPMIPGDIGVPILIVQHMPPLFTQSLAESLSARCALKVIEASDGCDLSPNTAYIAPGGRHMKLLASGDGQARIVITDDVPENNCKPSVDYLFRSAAECIPGRSMAAILTGMGTDGTIGLRLLRRHGCFTVAQDEATSVVFGMPKSAIEANVVDVVLPVDHIASRIVATIKGRLA
jgi:two-component system chemotaxis response regulator CheB